MGVEQEEVAALPQAARIRAARALRGLTQHETVQLMSRPISAAALSQIEAGRIRPAAQTARELARALEVPEGFFFVQWPGSEEPTRTYFRDLRATKARERRRASALALILNDVIAAIEVHVRLPEVSLPSFPIESDALSGEIEQAAERLRAEWNLGAEPIPHMIRELERHGVAVARLTMGHHSVDAFSVRFGRRPAVLLTEDKSNYVRSRFDAAHELAHLVMHHNSEDGKRYVELQAHEFASALLLPRAVAEAELPHKLEVGVWGGLAELKRRWGISMAALLMRANRIGVLNADAYRTAMKYMSAKGWRINEPGDKEMGPPEAPLLIERALRTIEVEAGITTEALIQSAHLPLADTLDLIRAASDRRPTVEI